MGLTLSPTTAATAATMMTTTTAAAAAAMPTVTVRMVVRTVTTPSGLVATLHHRLPHGWPANLATTTAQLWRPVQLLRMHGSSERVAPCPQPPDGRSQRMTDVRAAVMVRGSSLAREPRTRRVATTWKRLQLTCTPSWPWIPLCVGVVWHHHTTAIRPSTQPARAHCRRRHSMVKRAWMRTVVRSPGACSLVL